MRQHAAQGTPPKKITMNWDRCPVCEGPVAQIKCKLVCAQCHSIIENCNGD